MKFGFFRQRASRGRVKPSVPAGTRVYAIGDVHGCLAELNGLLDVISSDMRAYRGRAVVIFLGDLIDRGPDSAGVIERVAFSQLPGDDQFVVMGNHEEAMLGAVDDGRDVDDWLSYGGLQTLESYGIGRLAAADLAERMRELIPSDHLSFLRMLPDHVRIGDYLFVHAGVRPGIPIEQQRSADLRWIRADFLESEVDHGVTVVHGHTISREPEFRDNRIGIDTGCYAGGPLTALVLENDQRRLLQVPGLAVAA